MEVKSNNGSIYYIHIDDNSDSKQISFSPISGLNTDSKKINSIKITSNKILSISSENELLQWEQNKENESILTEKPSIIFPKIKFKSISLSKSVTIGLDLNGKVLVWGQSNEGVLGLGFDVTKVENPTYLEDLKNIIQISSSDHHAVAVNSEGMAYSWGTGKYGELGLERSIYSSIPQQIPSDTYYTKVFCSNLISCFLDFEGHFHYFGVVIKQLSGTGSTLTIKSLLEEQIYHDGKVLFLEKQIEELENEKFKNIMIGNGFIVLLSFNGNIFILEYNDKLTKLYTKYTLDNISLVNGDIFGFAKEEKNNINTHYLLKWKSHYITENDLYSDSWHTTIWKFIDDNNILDNCELVDSNSSKNNIFLKFISSNENKEEIVHLSENDNIEKSLNLEINQNSNANNIMNIIKLEYESEFDDSYNLKYKRNQLNSLIQDMTLKTFNLNNQNNIYNSFYALGKNRSVHFNNNNYNQSTNKTVLFQKKTNSPLIIGNSRNIFDKNGINFGNKNSTLKGNFIYSSNGEFISKNNKNDINDNVNIYEMDDNRSNINNNKSNQIRKNRNASEDNYNYNSDENEYIKNELNKYRNDVDNIINNFNQKKQSKSFSVLGKNKKKLNNNINNINIIDKNKEDNTSYDNSNNDLIKGFSITKSISNNIHNNDNSLSINNENNKNKKGKKSSNNLDYENNNEENEENKINNRKSRNKDRISPNGKRIFKDKKLKNLVEHLSLIEEESEPSLSVLKRKRLFSFSKNTKKSNLKNKKDKVKNLKRKFYDINKNNDQDEEKKTESINESEDEDFDENRKNNFSDTDQFNMNIINKKDEEQKEDEKEINEKNKYKKNTKRKGKNNYINNESESDESNEKEENNIYDKNNKKNKGKKQLNTNDKNGNDKSINSYFYLL